ncbi:MAG: hypothetical protein IKO48_00735 [Elusimicrobia bacterium]|nr:hypothetical protein [Elusimicrobiota bacterium]
METEIRKSGKFISKGGNGMQQNLKEIVEKEAFEYIRLQTMSAYDFLPEPGEVETIDSLTKNICNLVMSKVKNMEYEIIKKEVKKVLRTKKAKDEISWLEAYGGFHDKNKVICNFGATIKDLPKPIQKFVPEWEEEIKKYLEKEKELKKHLVSGWISFKYGRKRYSICSNFFKSSKKSSFENEAFYAISKTIREDIKDLVSDYKESFY